MIACPYCASSLTKSSETCPVCGSRLTSPALKTGTPLAGTYRVEQVLGQGGFGITYLALDENLEHRVAIKELFPEGSTRRDLKVIPPPGVNFAELHHKFLEEARVVQRFNHPNIVRVYGTFSENGTAYIVMEALTGSTLTSDVISHGPFPEATVLEMARQLSAALTVVHEAGWLHRDIKPDNVFLADDERVVLIDFGSARGFAAGQVKRLTRLLTPGYAAPEQYASQAAFGAYTDVYGLAATLYYAVEGRMPPMATALMLGEKLEFEKAQALRVGLEAGLRVKVGERPQTIMSLLDKLEQPLPTAPLEVTKVPIPKPIPSTPVPLAHVQGWYFGKDVFYRGSQLFSYNDFTEVKIIRRQKYSRVKNQASSPLAFSIVISIFGVAISMFSLSIPLFFMSVAVVLFGVVGQYFVDLRKFHYGIWLETKHGQRLVDHVDSRQNAVALGRAIQKYAHAPLTVLG
jgi:serine/threonine protein kinase